MEYREFTGKTVEDAVMEAAIKLETTSDKLDYEILEKGSSGFLGIGSIPAKIKARKLKRLIVWKSFWQTYSQQCRSMQRSRLLRIKKKIP